MPITALLAEVGFEGARLQLCREEAAKKLWGTLLVGAPCFSRGKLDFSPAEESSISKWALAPGFPAPGAKAQDQTPTFSWSAEALLPPHNAGAPTKKYPPSVRTAFFHTLFSRALLQPGF